MVEKKIYLGCNCLDEYLERDADAVLWINDYYRSKAKELQLYGEGVEQYVIPELWQSKEEFCDAKDYSIKVYKMIIEKIAEQLDAMHNSCFGVQGWNIILYDWLYVYIEAFYDKYIRMKYAVAHYPNLYLCSNNIWYISRGNDLSNSEALQAQQYIDVYRLLYGNDFHIDAEQEQCEIMHVLPKMVPDSETHKTSHRIMTVIKQNICHKEATLYITTSYLDLSKTILELLSQGKIRKLTLPDVVIPENAFSADMRKKLKGEVDWGDEFINLIYDCLWKYIPMQFIEDFQDYYKAYQNLGLKMPSKIIDSIAIYGNLISKIFIADAINHGSKLEMIQHGGNYCIEKYISWWEFDIAYKYFTWGDGFIKNNKGNMYAMPLPKTLSLKKNRRMQGSILFVGYANYPYITRFWNLYAMKVEKLFSSEDVFFQLLQQKVREALKVRCYHADLWWNRKNILAQKFLWMRFDDNQNYYTSMKEARLVVVSIISTTCMEAINCDIPTIIFCSEEFFVPDENAAEILEQLRKVKVLLDTPEEAAELVNEIQDHVDVWWNEKERRCVLDKFRKMYAQHSKYAKYKWIRQLIKESRNE